MVSAKGGRHCECLSKMNNIQSSAIINHINLIILERFNSALLI